ncbi:MAG: Uma2 family endonuclease [Pirellula sp.]|jgi:Uma2 family endonuclease|nr:Uma2 family endonuclease [Pirellula sp.]
MSHAERPEYSTPEEYLRMEERGLTKSEYVDGWIRAMSGSTHRHNRIKLNCLVQLSLKLRDQRCQPLDSDTKVRLDNEGKRRFYYPDAQVVCDSNELSSVYQDRPDLIIEVLSPSTRRYDLDEKMTAYLTISSLQCYLLLEQHQPIAIIMRRTRSGFLREDIQGMNASIDLPTLGISLATRDIYDGIEFTDECVQEPEPEYEAL